MESKQTPGSKKKKKNITSPLNTLWEAVIWIKLVCEKRVHKKIKEKATRSTRQEEGSNTKTN